MKTRISGNDVWVRVVFRSCELTPLSLSRRYWNFICRQFFVLITYCSAFNRMHNFILAVLQFLMPIFIWTALPLSFARLALLYVGDSVGSQWFFGG